jgi:hypothetical protein
MDAVAAPVAGSDPSNAGAVVIDAAVYVGTLKGTMPRPYVHIKQEILPASYTYERDQVIIVTLYTYGRLE